MDTDKYLEILPPKWKCYRLKNVSVFIKDGTHGTHPRQDSGIPLLSAKNITEQGKVYWDETDSFISDKEYGTISQSCQIQINDLLLTIVGSLGRRALVIDEQPFAVQRSVAIIRPDQNFVVPGFLYHVAGDDAFQRQLIVQSNATAQAGLYLEKLNNVKIIIPSLIREQELISDILDTIEEKIQRTEHLIAKLKAIKQGLLHDLLTRGLDESGKLRDPIAHPEQFKDSPLGKIPNEWEICRAYDVLDNLDNKRVPVSEDERNNRKGDVPYYGANGQQGWIDDYLFDEPLILLAEDGGDFDNFATKPVAYRIAGKSWVNNHAHVLRPKSLDDFSFLFFSLEHKDIRIFIKGGTRSKLNKTELNQILLKWPSSQEERKIIGQTVETIDCQKELELIYYNKLSAIKKGLMNDLLTGKVRVKI